MKKTLSLLLVVLLIFGIFPTAAFAANEVYDEQYIKNNYYDLKKAIDETGYVPKTGNKTVGGRYKNTSYYLEHISDTDELRYTLFDDFDDGALAVVEISFDFERTSQMNVTVEYYSDDDTQSFVTSAIIDAHDVPKDTNDIAFSFRTQSAKNINSRDWIQKMSNLLLAMGILSWDFLMEQVNMTLPQIGFCLRCKEHTFTDIKNSPATCTANGEMVRRCSNCGLLQKETISAKGEHNYVSKLKPATTKTDGDIEKKCSVCGDVESSEAIARIQSVTLKKTTYIYDGEAKKPTVIVKDRTGEIITKENYSVKYDAGRKAIGEYKVLVTFKGNYAGKVTLTFKIIPGKVTELKAAGNKVTWSPVNGAQKYVVYYSTSKTSGYKKLGNTAKTAFSLKGLTSGKTYYIKVRALTKAEGTSFYGSYSSALKVKTK